jgi:hypothetical protein
MKISLQVLLEAFLFAVGYGGITVFACNLILVGRVDDEIGWLVPKQHHY